MPQIKTLQKKFGYIKNCNASSEGIAACHNLSQKKLVYPSKTQKKRGKKKEGKQERPFNSLFNFYFILF